MEVTTNQTLLLVNAIKRYEAKKVGVEHASKEKQTAFEKLKECCQGAGSEEQVLTKAYEVLAKAYITKILHEEGV